MNPYEFGLAVGEMEKAAINPASVGGRIMNALRGVASGAKTLDRGSQHIVKGFGGLTEGIGKMIGTKARTSFSPTTGTSLGNSTGLGGLFLGLGRGMQTGGKKMIDSVPGTNPRWLRDLYGMVGHGSRLSGSAVRGVGHATNMAGEGLQAAGRGLNALSQTSYGVPTLAAAGLLGGTAAVAPKLPLPNVKLRSPVDLDFSYKTRNPIEVNW